MEGWAGHGADFMASSLVLPASQIHDPVAFRVSDTNSHRQDLLRNLHFVGTSILMISVYERMHDMPSRSDRTGYAR